MTVRKHHTEVQPADTMPTDDFDALLRASSLGAPHVLAETEPVPPDVRSRLNQAAVSSPAGIAAGPDHVDTGPLSETPPVRHRSPTRPAARPVPHTDASPRPRHVLLARDVESYSASESAFGTALRRLREYLREVMERALRDGHSARASGERLRGDGFLAVLPWESREPNPTIMVSMLGEFSSGKSLPCSPETTARWVPQLRVKEQDSAAYGSVDAWYRWRGLPPEGGWVVDPVRLATTLRSRDARRWAPSTLLPQLAGLSRRFPERSPDTALCSPASDLLLSALCGFEPGDTAQARAHPAADETVARELGYLTLHLWKTPCREQARRTCGGSDSDTFAWPHSAEAPFFPHSPRLAWLLAEDCREGAEEEFLSGIWNGIRDAMERVSAFLLQDHQRHASQPPSGNEGLARCRMRTSSPASSDLVPVWQALADCWVARHATMPLRLHADEHDPGRLLPARFTYRTLDPYAVEIVFRPQSPDAKRWVFARDLLLDGLNRSAGEGNVIVQPRPGLSADGRGTFIHLKSPQGTALLSAPQAELENYLEKTQQAVPSGAEHQHMSDTLDNLERELDALASGAIG